MKRMSPRRALYILQFCKNYYTDATKFAHFFDTLKHTALLRFEQIFIKYSKVIYNYKSAHFAGSAVTFLFINQCQHTKNLLVGLQYTQIVCGFFSNL